MWPPYTEAEMKPPVEESMAVKLVRWAAYLAAFFVACALAGAALHVALRVIAWGWRLV